MTPYQEIEFSNRLTPIYEQGSSRQAHAIAITIGPALSRRHTVQLAWIGCRGQLRTAFDTLHFYKAYTSPIIFPRESKSLNMRLFCS